MLIEITSKIIDVTPSIREYVASKFEKLERMQVPMISPHVYVGKEGEHYVIEAKIQIPFGKLFAEAEHEDLYAAINALEQKLERQIIRHIHRPDARRNRNIQRPHSMAAML
ncbi:MAG: ribosome-associated translation inhibitor RaiA [Tolumonas sp.]